MEDFFSNANAVIIEEVLCQRTRLSQQVSNFLDLKNKIITIIVSQLFTLPNLPMKNVDKFLGAICQEGEHI